MNDLDHDPYLGPALRERVASELPDLEHLASTSLAAGTRLRRRRRIGATAGAVAGVAVIALATSQAGGGTTASDPGFAESTPASTPAAPTGLQVGQVLDLGNGLTGTVIRDKSNLYELGSSTLPGSGTGFVVVVDGPKQAIDAWWATGMGPLTDQYPGITAAVSLAKADELGLLGMVDEVPVSVPAGWTCEWFLVDDKAACTSDDGGVAGLVIRDAADRAAWLGDPDKGANTSTYVTDAHDGIFISVQGGQGTTDAEIQELGASLTWVD